jgi:hypothetical protein
MTAVIPARRSMSGSTKSATICCISHGTPGTAYSTFAPSAPMGQTRPGAVPGMTGMGVAPRGTSAWRRLFSGMARPAPVKMALISATSASSRSRGTPMTSAITSLVMSSWVGPRPPHTTTASARARASSMAERMRPQLSPTLVWKNESIPTTASCSPIHDELVSTIWPSSNSVPTATISHV